MTDTRKQEYTFGSNSAVRKFYQCAECIGYQADGRGVWAWKNGLWIIVEHTGASTWYRAHRVCAETIATPIDTWAAREAMASVIRSQEVA